jgi:hypothetical protein
LLDVILDIFNFFAKKYNFERNLIESLTGGQIKKLYNEVKKVNKKPDFLK